MEPCLSSPAGKPLGSRERVADFPASNFQMYVISLLDPVYHLPRDEQFTLCMLWIGQRDKRRRHNDRHLVSELPANHLWILCPLCELLSGGLSQRAPNLTV